MSNKSLVDQLDLNDLLYLQGTDASVADNRQLRKFYPEKTVFRNNEKILFRLHGRQFIDMKNSSLRFQVKFTGDTVKAGINSYSGSILNIFKRSRVISSTGKSISDVDNHNMLQRMSSRLYRGSNHNSVLGATYGIQGAPSSAASKNEWVNGTTYEFVVPMRMVNPFWDNEQLLPPQIAEGLSVELFLENLTRCGVSDDGTLTSYQVTNPEIIADVYLVSPSIDAAVASMSNQKMVYEYKDFVQIESTMSVDSGDISLPMTYPLSNALEAFVTVRTVSNANTTTTDSFACVPINVNVPNENDQLVWRIGQLQLPQARMLAGPQLYNMLLNGRKQLSSNIVDDFDLSVGDFQGTFGCYFANLRRSNLFDNSGREVSNQQSLVAEIRIATPSNNIVDFFVKYIGRVVINDNFLTVES